MPKANKSSASSGTRKKHARKAAAASGIDSSIIITQQKQKSSKGKPKKGDPPRIKQYIPPVKPSAPRPDPLDTLGLATKLPPELVVELRRFGKKDTITKQKALEEIQINWVEKLRNRENEEEEDVVNVLEQMLPVWLHHYPSFALHPSRKIRLLAISLHSSLLAIPLLRSRILYFLNESADISQSEFILGAWCLSSFDIDRLVSLKSKSSWDGVVSWETSADDEASSSVISLHTPHLSAILGFIQKAIMDPISLHTSFLPPAPIAVLPLTPRGAAKSKQIARTPLPSPRTPDESTRPAKSDADEEVEDDRRARYRISALGALKWIAETAPLSPAAAEPSEQEPETPTTPSAQIQEFLSSLSSYDSFWTTLYHGPKPPFLSSPSIQQDPGSKVVGFGNAQPEYPKAWILDAGSSTPPNQTRDDEDDEDEENEDGDEEDTQAEPKEFKSISYVEFLEFLRLGCGGSPVQSYPIIIVVLSTIPRQVLPLTYSSLNTLFSTFWAAVDSRALASLLERTSLQAGAAFLSSLLESVIFLVSKSIKEGDGDESNEVATKIVEEQMKNVWGELHLGVNLKVDVADAGDALAKFLTRLSDLRKDLFDVAWGIITTPSGSKSSAIFDETELLAVMHSKLAEGSIPNGAVEKLIADKATTAIDQVKTTESFLVKGTPGTAVKELTDLLNRFSNLMSRNPALMKELDSVMLDHYFHQYVQPLPSVLIEFVLAYLDVRKDSTRAAEIWSRLLSAIGSPNIHSDQSDPGVRILLDRRKDIPTGLVAKGDELATYVEDTVRSILADGDQSVISIIVELFKHPEQFISEQVARNNIDRVVSSAVQSITLFLCRDDIPLTSLLGSLDVLCPLFSDEPPSPFVFEEAVITNLLPAIYVLAFVLAKVDSPSGNLRRCINSATVIWKRWNSSNQGEQFRGQVKTEVESLMKDTIPNVHVRISPSAVIQAALSSELETSTTSVLQLVVPSQSTLGDQYRLISVSYVDNPISLFGPSIPSKPPKGIEYDSHGFSSYARCIWALLEVLGEDRPMSRNNLWVLPHIILVDTISSDHLNNYGGLADGVFSNSVSKEHLVLFSEKAQMVSTYLMNAITDDLPSGWHSQMTGIIKKGERGSQSSDPTTTIFGDIFVAAMENGIYRDLRILKFVLSKLLRNATAEDSENWVVLAQGLLDKAPQTSLAISLSVTNFGLESSKLDRYRNELASRLSGVPPKKANSDGLKLLRHLISTAPHPESDAVFLPQQRAVFLIQGLQKWIASDEDLDEDINGLLAALFTNMAPIIQSVPGAHWDLIYDLMEENLENSSLKDESTFGVLLYTLQLIIKVEELASSNKGLRTTWNDRKTSILQLVGQRFIEEVDVSSRSSTRDECRELLIAVARDMPVPIGEEDGLPALCRLLKDPSLEIQKASYHLLMQVVSKRTERIVVEAAVASEENDSRVELPKELLDLLQKDLYSGDEDVSDEELATYLFAWMVTFDMFKDASLKVRNDYIEQLRNLDIIPSRFLPNIFSILDIGASGKRPFKVDQWAVDEFYVSLMDDSFSDRFKVLAAHLLYRAYATVPLLIRTWYSEIRDRQLSGAVATYTTQSFSPIIISHELSSLKDPDAIKELQDENFTVKIFQAANEVSCNYVVDEQPIEIRIKFPQDYPLNPIEIRDINKVVILETKWRSWKLSVQQAAQSGRILDAVSLFKRNVTLHFEGLQECAICYS
ncbi:listerin E3 ubiquitin protein ligase 1 [Tulasnella sp. 418]|nr:listerin E3 ubiquitin protein ligase 1 [Tulasnella sp. 418]